ncbi:MAG TPA: electron transport complex subunit RsxE [Clostridiales bacterium]|nr:electron transport complex subunit RsxE [Clostridiales bacterium]
MKHNYLKQLKSGILDQNPTLVQLLGMCPTLATTTSLKNAFGMGMAATAVLICSNVFISLLRKFIPKQVRIAAYIVIVSGFVTAVELLMRTYMVSLYRSLGLFIPLIVVNCIILARAEAFASKNPPLPSAMDGLSMGLGFTFALCILGTVRELLGAGSLLGHRILPEAYPDMVIFILPAGAFLTLGFTIAAVQKIKDTVEEKKHRAAEDGKEETA